MFKQQISLDTLLEAGEFHKISGFELQCLRLLTRDELKKKKLEEQKMLTERKNTKTKEQKIKKQNIQENSKKTLEIKCLNKPNLCNLEQDKQCQAQEKKSYLESCWFTKSSQMTQNTIQFLDFPEQRNSTQSYIPNPFEISPSEPPKNQVSESPFKEQTNMNNPQKFRSHGINLSNAVTPFDDINGSQEKIGTGVSRKNPLQNNKTDTLSLNISNCKNNSNSFSQQVGQGTGQSGGILNNFIQVSGCPNYSSHTPVYSNSMAIQNQNYIYGYNQSNDQRKVSLSAMQSPGISIINQPLTDNCSYQNIRVSTNSSHPNFHNIPQNKNQSVSWQSDENNTNAHPAFNTHRYLSMETQSYMNFTPSIEQYSFQRPYSEFSNEQKINNFRFQERSLGTKTPNCPTKIVNNTCLEAMNQYRTIPTSAQISNQDMVQQKLRDNSLMLQLDHISKYESLQKKQSSAIGYSQEDKQIELNSFIPKDTFQNILCTSEPPHFEEFILGFKVVNDDSSSKKKNTLNRVN